MKIVSIFCALYLFILSLVATVKIESTIWFVITTLCSALTLFNLFNSILGDK